MKTNWALQDAKNHFSRVVDQALHEGPQTVTRHGRECVVVISTQTYHDNNRRKKQGTLTDFFKKSPLCGVYLNTERFPDLPREVSL